MGKNRAQNLTDELKRLAKRGQPEALEHYKSVQGHAGQRSFGMKLSIDPEMAKKEARESLKLIQEETDLEFRNQNSGH
eukprot:5571325-Alexandrium_andersonii.AAC.1